MQSIGRPDDWRGQCAPASHRPLRMKRKSTERKSQLPEEVNLEKAYAEFVNGVLEVSIPVTGTKHKPREKPVYEGGKVKTAGG